MRGQISRAALLCLTAFISAGCASTNAPVAPDDVSYAHGVVAADHARASRAGLEMLKRGGNAVDAAVATSFALAVVRPQSCGLGGGGFMVIHLAGDEKSAAQDIALTYRETAPSGIDSEYYVRLDVPFASRVGPDAVGVPGAVAGLLHALEDYGTLDRATVLAPAICAAEDGFAIDASYVAAVQEVVADLQEHSEWIDLIGRDRYEWFRHRFLFDGEAAIGDVLRQPELARTLRLIARDGRQAFYEGEIASQIAQVCPSMTSSDLGDYRVRQSAPLSGEFRGRRVVAMPPPSSGGIAILQTLGLLERRWADSEILPAHSPAAIHLVVEAMKHAFADRARWLADDRFADVPTTMLLSDSYLDMLAGRIDPDHTQSSDTYGLREQLPEDGGTSHISVIDRWGNAVASTETINLEFGSLMPVPEFGFMLNNEMDDFLTIPGERNAFGLQQSARNLPQAGKWPLSSMSPTIVIGSAGRVEVVVGASGGPRIISASLQVMLNVLVHDLSAHEAVRAPRFHHQWMPDVLEFEDDWTDEQTGDAMRAMGHQVGRRRDVGVVQLIRRSPNGRGWSAASDPRKGGEPAGW